jgi:hypothetical protein
MINIDDAIHVHEVLIDKFGDSKGIRDISLCSQLYPDHFKHLIKNICIQVR